MAEPILLVPQKVKEEIAHKMKEQEIVSKKIAGKPYRFRRISMKLSHLFYYTKNVRNYSIRKEYIIDNDLPEDFFDREKMTDLATQQAYHPIILEEALQKKDEYNIYQTIN